MSEYEWSTREVPDAEDVVRSAIEHETNTERYRRHGVPRSYLSEGVASKPYRSQFRQALREAVDRGYLEQRRDGFVSTEKGRKEVRR